MLDVNERPPRAAFERCVRFSAAFNFRDLGGYSCTGGRSTRWRRVFRSDALHWMTSEDSSRAVEHLGVRTVIDLRDSSEVQRDGRAPFIGEHVSYRHVPILEGAKRASQQARDVPDFDMATLYVDMLDKGGRDFARALQTLAESVETPVVFHCAAGKDRTGLLAAILLGTVGVPDEDIVSDYALTSRHMGPIIERMRRSPGYSQIVGDLPAHVFSSRPDSMRRTLDGLRARWGSPREYALAQGVSPDDLARLEAALLE